MNQIINDRISRHVSMLNDALRLAAKKGIPITLGIKTEGAGVVIKHYEQKEASHA